MLPRLLQIASGPVRPIRRWSVVRFSLLALFWAIFAVVSAYFYLAYKDPRAGASFSAFSDRLAAEAKDLFSLTVPIGVVGIAVFTSVHYLVLRMLPFEKRRPFQSWERWLTLGLIAILVSGPVYQLKKALRTRHLYEVCYGYRIWLPSHWDGLVASGRYSEVVREMEDASRAFRSARLELGDRFVQRRQYSGAGWSYMLITLAYYHPEPFALNAPGSMVEFFCGGVDDSLGDGSNPPKSCEPLAREMRKSGEPIVRITGLWWLGEKEAFDREVEAQLAAGDTSYQAWKDLGDR